MKLILTTAFIVSYVVASAQFMSVPTTTTIRTPYGNVNHTTYTSMPMYYGTGNPSAKYTFTVVLKNDSSITSRSRIDITSKTNTIKVKVDKEKKTILPGDTKELYRFDNYTKKKISGMPTDSCWLFLCSKGKINTYSNLSEQGSMYAIAFQEGDDGPITTLTKDNLMFIIGGDPKLRKLIEKGKLIKAIDSFNGLK